MPILFLSHAGVDTEAARQLKERLEESDAGKAAGLKVWFDKIELQPGTEGWQEQLERAIGHEATAFAVYLGSRGVVTWVRREVRLALSRATVDESFPFIPVFAADSPGPKGLPPFAQQHQGVRDPLRDVQELQKLLGAVLGRTGQPPPVIRDEPYVGLRSMDEREADRFFGREAELDELIERVTGRRLVALIADSGTGKSSLVRAGLIPAWRRHELADPNRLQADEAEWHVVVTRPGGNPMEELIKAVDVAATRLKRSDEAKAAFRKGINLANLSETAYALICGFPSETTETLLVVDQFEELFTQASEERRRPFVDLLLFLIDPQKTALKFRVVLTMRADYVNLLRDLPDLRAALGMDGEAVPGRTGVLRLKALSPEGIARIVHEPMRLAGHTDRTERDKLLTAIRYDLGTNPGDTALLAVALYRLWKKRDASDPNALVAVYEEIGRVAGALASTAEEAVEGLNSDLLEGLWARLIQAGYGRAGTRRIARLDEFDDDRRKVAQSLAGEERGRLLLVGARADLARPPGDSRSGEPEQTLFVEIAHEALIAQWSDLQDFVRANGDDLRRFGRLMEKHEEWHPADSAASVGAHPSPPRPSKMHLSSTASRLLGFRPPAPNSNPERLAAGADLEVFQGLAKRRDSWLNDHERRFIAQSQAEQTRRQRNEQWTLKILAISAVALLVVAAIAGQQWWQATTNYQEARNNEVRALSALASTATASGAPFDALRLAIASWPRHPADDRPMLTKVLDTLSETVMAFPIVESQQFNHLVAARFSPDGRRLAMWAGSTAALIEAASGIDVGSRATFGSSVGDVAFSTDGRRLAIGAGKTATLRDVETGAVVGSPTEVSGDVSRLSFSGDGRRLAIQAKRQVTLLDAGDGTVIGSSPSFDSDVRGLLWTKNSQRVVIWTDREVTLIDSSGARIGTPLASAATVRGVRLSADGQRFVMWSMRDVALIDADTGTAVKPLPSFRGIQSVVVSSNTERLAIRSGRTVTLVNTREGVVLGTPIQLTETAVRMSFSPEGRHLILLGRRDGSLVDGMTGATIASITTKGGQRVTFSPDSALAVIGDSNATLIDAVSGRTIAPIPTSGDFGHRNVQFSADSRRLVVRSGKTAALLEAPTGLPVASLAPFNEEIQDVAWSADSRQFAMWSGRTAVLVDAATGAIVGSLLPFGDDIKDCAFSADGRRLVVLAGKTLTLIDVGTRVVLPSGPEFNEDIQGIVFSGDRRRVAAYAGATAALIDAVSATTVGSPRTLDSQVKGVMFSGDNQRLAVVTERSGILLDASFGGDVAALPSFDTEAKALFSRDGRHLAMWDERTVKLIDAKSGKAKDKSLSFDDDIGDVSFTTDSRRILVESGEWMILLDSLTGSAVGQRFRRGSSFQGTTFSADGRRLAVIDGRTLALINTDTAMPVGSPPPFGEDIVDADTSADSRRLVIWGGRTAAMYDLATGAAVGQPISIEGEIEEVAFAPDSKRLVIRAGRTVKLVDATTAAAIGSSPSFGDDVRYMSFSADGQKLAVLTDAAGTLIDATKGATTATLPPVTGDIQVAAFSKDGRLMAVLAERRLVLFDLVGNHWAGESSLKAGFESFSAVAFSPDGKLVMVTNQRESLIIDSASARPIAHLQGEALVQHAPNGRAQAILAARHAGKRLLLKQLTMPQGEHLLDIACTRLPERARDLRSTGQKLGIKINDPICAPVPPPPDWKRIAKGTAPS